MSWEEKMFKAVLLGDTKAGKSTFFNNARGLKDKIATPTTSGEVQILTNIFQDICVKISLWDTAGQEKYNGLTNVYIRNCNVAAIFIDATSDTFESYNRWVDFLMNCTENVNIIIVFNKMDLVENQIKQKLKDIEDFCTHNGIPDTNVVKMSAIKGECDELITKIFSLALQSDIASATLPQPLKASDGNKECC